jgi:maltose-binding protein MalE
MRTNWQRTLLIGVLTIFLLLLMACGGDGGANENTAAEPTAAPSTEEEAEVEEAAPTEEMMEEEPEEVAEETTSDEGLVLWVYDDGRIGVLTELGQQFEEEFGVSVTIEAVDLGEIRNQILLGAASGEGPDMAIIPHDNLGPMVENGVVATVDLGDKAGEYLPNAIDGFTYNGELYGLPLAVENIGFFRNTDLVSDAPTSWDEVYTIGQELVDSGDADMAIGLPDLGYNIYPLYTSFGGYIFGRDASGSFTFDDIGMNNEGMVEGLTYVQTLIDDGLVSETIDWEAAHVMFETGRTPFIMTGPWAINRFQTAGVNYAISAFPDGGHPFLGVQGLIFNANSDNLLLAQTFALEIIATQEGMQAIFDAEPRPSAWASIFEAAADTDTIGFNEAGVSADPMPSIPAMGFVWDAWANAGTLVATGELEPQEALDSAVEQIETQVAEAE